MLAHNNTGWDATACPKCGCQRLDVERVHGEEQSRRRRDPESRGEQTAQEAPCQKRRAEV